MKLGIKHLIVLLVAIFSVISYALAVCSDLPCPNGNLDCAVGDCCMLNFKNLFFLSNIDLN